MPNRNPALYEALKAYSKVALTAVAQGAPESPLGSAFGYRWVRVDGADVQSDTPAYGLVPSPLYPHRLVDDLHTTSEFSACVESMRSDATMAKHLDTLVGTSGSAMRMEPAQYVDGFWQRLARRVGRYQHDETVFEELYESLERDFYAGTIEVRVVAPLEDLRSSTPVVLRKDLAIERLSENEVSKCLDMGMNFGHRMGPFVLSAPEYGIVYRALLPKRVGNEDVSRGRAGFDPWEMIDQVITALAVFRRGRFAVPGLIMAGDSIFRIGTQGSTRSMKYGHFHPNVQFETRDADAFREFFRLVSGESVQRRGALVIALHRFRYAAERQRIEDRLIDLLIAAEALFLQEGPGELRYRLAQRAAFFLADTQQDRLAIFEDMKAAYDVRSRLVHGSAPKPPKRPDGSPMQLNEFVAVIEERLRAALHKAVNLAQDPNSPETLVNWDSLIFSAR